MKRHFYYLFALGLTLTYGCQSSLTNNAVNDTPMVAVQDDSAVITLETQSFNEEMYLFANPDVAELIKQGKYKSGLDHYTQVGQKTTKSNGELYESFFTGTSHNDTIEGFGQQAHAHLAGVEFALDRNSKEPFPLAFKNNGAGEIDTLIGVKEGGNEFILGSVITAVNPKAEPFYVGQGDKDYATIKNFVKSKDAVILPGQPEQYQWKASGENLLLSTRSGDLIAVVEGVSDLQVGDAMKEMGVFILK